MRYECVEDKQVPGEWRVEAIGSDGEGYVTIFAGPEAKERALEYARWKQDVSDSLQGQSHPRTL